MPERPDLRQIAASLRDSLDGLEREALIDILSHVLSEYVVEGPPPLATAQVERLEDLEGLTLAGLISALQMRLDVAGLELFRVEQGEVRVQTAGGWVALQPGRTGGLPRENERGAPPRAAPPPAPTGRSAVDEAIARGRGDLAGGERGVIRPPAPRPRGLAVSGRPASGGAPAPAPPGQPAPPAPPEPPPSEPPASPSSERNEDDASIRFSLLELD